MSYCAAALIEQLARVRWLAERAGVTPEDVRLSDLHPSEQARLIAAATDDFWRLIAADTTPVHDMAAEAAAAMRATSHVG